MPELRITDRGFLLDGEPRRIVSGALHYFRIHPEHWADRLRKARLMGLNAIDTYVPWNLHERRRGEFRLDGGLDLPRFLDLAAAEGLHVLLRPGPYICGEWEGGGLPSWLALEPDYRPRSADPGFLSAVDGYFARLLPRLERHFGPNGGPVVALQVENEFGALGEEAPDYLDHLAKRLAEYAPGVALFTCDQAEDDMLARGGLPGVLRTVNFDIGAGRALAALRRHQPAGPLMTSEFWVGWFDHWGGRHHVRPAVEVAEELETLLAAGASVNFYMFHGGTNFGFTSGANDKHRYTPTITSYDYDSPLDEAGDPTHKYAALRGVIARHLPEAEAAELLATPIPSRAPKLAVPGIGLTAYTSMLDYADSLDGAEPSEQPPTMEQLGQDFGFVRYRTVLGDPRPGLLRLHGFGDRAQVFLDRQHAGTVERENRTSAVELADPRPGAVLEILVENQGRVNYGPGLIDIKGLTGQVTLGGVPLTGWTSASLPLDTPPAPKVSGLDGGRVPPGPAFHRGEFEIDEPADTFLAVDGWAKGAAWVNGFHLGRYWSRGPQRSLYVPGPVLRAGRNEVVLLELEAAADHGRVDLRDHAEFGPTED